MSSGEQDRPINPTEAGSSRPERRTIPSAEKRLIDAARRLFARAGFEHTTTASIAREAGSSESQLLKYFGNKEGLLEAVFIDGWQRLGVAMTAGSVASTPVEGLRLIFGLIIRTFDEDHDLRDVMLLEGRRIRAHSEILLTSGYARLQQSVAQLAAPILKGTALGTRVRPEAVASALIGMLESMLRDQIIAERKGLSNAPTSAEIQSIFQNWIHSLAGGVSLPSGNAAEASR